MIFMVMRDACKEKKLVCPGNGLSIRIRLRVSIELVLLCTT